MRRALGLIHRLPAVPGICSSTVLAASSQAQACLTPIRQFSTCTPVSAPVRIEDEPYCRQRQFIVLGNRIPFMAPDAWVAPNSILVGDVDLGDKVTVWYGCVLRGDLNGIKIGSFSNIQDRTVIHAARRLATGLTAATSVGEYVSIGQGCLLRSTMIESESLIGDKCILLEGSLVETNAVLAPGSVLPAGRLVPSGQLWAGNPARYVRDLTKDEIAEIPKVAEGMFRVGDMHSSEFLPNSFQYVEAEKLKKALEENSSL